MNSIAAGVPADTVAPAIKARESDIARVEVQPRKPRREQTNIEKLRAALKQRAKQWKRDLRSEPQIARLVLRRLVGPLTLWDENGPEWFRFETTPTTGLLDGLGAFISRLPVRTLDGSSPTGTATRCNTKFHGIAA